MAVLKCELRITGGARSGHREVFDKPYVGIGRHPMSDLRFDAERDIDASTRHAALVRTGNDYLLRDLGSTNGTYVNGKKLEADQPLKDGDQLRFGLHGPEVSFHLMREEGEEVVMPAVHVDRPSIPAGPRQGPSAPVPGTLAESSGPSTRGVKTTARREPQPPSRTGVLRAELDEHRSKNRGLVIALAIVVLGGLGTVLWLGRESQQQVRTVTTQLDSVNRELAALRQLQVATDSQANQLRAQLSREQDPARQQTIRTAIARVEQRSQAIATASEVDYTAIRRANDGAVAMISIKFASDTVQFYSGTAFSVNSRGQMITNAHNVVRNGERASEVAVQFSGSSDVLPARVQSISPNSDIALLQLESAGPFPAISGTNTSELAVGAPIASLGYPGGGRVARLVSGSVARVVPDSLYELDSFSGVGASGSPVFDREVGSPGTELEFAL